MVKFDLCTHYKFVFQSNFPIFMAIMNPFLAKYSRANIKLWYSEAKDTIIMSNVRIMCVLKLNYDFYNDFFLTTSDYEWSLECPLFFFRLL